MECIIDACKDILGILGKAKHSDADLRLMKYCVPLQTENGVLMFNLLTRELLLLTAEEYNTALSSEYLHEHWFTIPDDQNEMELVELVRWVRINLRKEPKHITNYTILTTTDCNARCFYCYQHGCARVNMSQDAADKVVAYIKNHCGENKVTVSWFGGEPLMNIPVIDRICEGLRANGIDFESHMTSNAYLFSDEISVKAVNSWNLKRIQITLDGTEEVYNSIKAYVYSEGSSYQIVMDNIRRLIETGVFVVVRMNMELNNMDNLMELAKELAVRFEGQKNLRAYPRILFDIETTWRERHTNEEWTELFAALQRLEEFLYIHGMADDGLRRLRRDLPLTHCMADSGTSVVIVPDGNIGLCEHYTDSEFFGHIASPERDKAMIDSWRELCDPIPECRDCFYFPECVELKKCNGRLECFEHTRRSVRHRTEQSMLNEYRIWCSQKAAGKSKNEGQAENSNVSVL